MFKGIFYRKTGTAASSDRALASLILAQRSSLPLSMQGILLTAGRQNGSLTCARRGLPAQKLNPPPLLFVLHPPPSYPDSSLMFPISPFPNSHSCLIIKSSLSIFPLSNPSSATAIFTACSIFLLVGGGGGRPNPSSCLRFWLRLASGHPPEQTCLQEPVGSSPAG